MNEQIITTETQLTTDLDKWAEENLDSEQLAKYKIDADNNYKVYRNLVEQGLIVETPVYQNKFSTVLNTQISVQVGIEMERFPPLTDRDNDWTEEYGGWVAQFLQSQQN
jgi:hypothetical protein